MSDELKHVSTGIAITQAQYESTLSHIFNSQATGDTMYASSATQLSRLAIGATNKILTVIGGVPTWQSTLAGLTLTSPILTTPALGTPASGDISSCTGSPTLTSPVISGAGATAAATHGFDATNHAILIGDGTTNNPIHIGHWQAYTPTLFNMTLGDGTLACAYARIGKTVICRISFVLGSTSAMGTGPAFSLPVTAAASNVSPVSVLIVDSGTTSYSGFAYLSSTTSVVITVLNATATYLNYVTITSTVPMTWVVGDQIYLTIAYEAA